MNGHISYIEKNYNEFKDLRRSIEQSEGENLLAKAVKTIVKLLFDERSSVIHQKGGKFSKDYLLYEVNKNIDQI